MQQAEENVRALRAEAKNGMEHNFARPREKLTPHHWAQGPPLFGLSLAVIGARLTRGTEPR